MAFFSSGFGLFILILAQCLAVTLVVLVSLAFLMYADRKVWAAVQMRRGPNVVGPWGLLQSFADFLKYIVKEVVIPAGAVTGERFMTRSTEASRPTPPSSARRTSPSVTVPTILPPRSTIASCRLP